MPSTLASSTIHVHGGFHGLVARHAKWNRFRREVLSYLFVRTRGSGVQSHTFDFALVHPAPDYEESG